MRNLILASIILVSLSNLFGQALSIKDCVEIALVNKETLESAQLDVAAANKGKLGSYSNILPSLGARSLNSFAIIAAINAPITAPSTRNTIQPNAASAGSVPETKYFKKPSHPAVIPNG